MNGPGNNVNQGTNGNGQNDNWGGAANAAQIADAASASGAFAFAGGSADSAVLTSLPAGAYTALLTGAGGTSGAAMIEIYQAP